MQTTGIKNFYFNKTVFIPFTEDHAFETGDLVVFEDEEKQEEMGEILFTKKECHKKENVSENTLILRKATHHDRQKHETCCERSREAFDLTLKKIAEHKLNMHLINVNYSFNGAKINFMFTAETRVDFRELVKDLAKCFKKQIHLQQIGPRDRAKMVPSYGKCGQQTCCTRYLDGFESITMDMVREQNLESRGSEKLSGLCGKLLCCLKHEVEAYQKMRRELPGVGSRVRTLKHEGRISHVDILNKKIKLEMKESPSVIISASDIKEVLEAVNVM